LIDFHNPEKWAINVNATLPGSTKKLADPTKARMIKDIDINKLNLKFFDGMHKLAPAYQA